jgi:hypothetical protein
VDADELALEVRRLRCELRDTQNRFAEEGARLNAELAWWRLKFYEACALIPDADPAFVHEVGRHCAECARVFAARENVDVSA